MHVEAIKEGGAFTSGDTIIGIDLAKRIFPLHGAGHDRSVIFRKRTSRGQRLALMSRLTRSPGVVDAIRAQCSHAKSMQARTSSRDASVRAPSLACFSRSASDTTHKTTRGRKAALSSERTHVRCEGGHHHRADRADPGHGLTPAGHPVFPRGSDDALVRLFDPGSQSRDLFETEPPQVTDDVRQVRLFQAKGRALDIADALTRNDGSCPGIWCRFGAADAATVDQSCTAVSTIRRR
jgi:hypothetical protein